MKCMFKYHKKNKKFGYHNKKGAKCSPSRATKAKHAKIMKQGMGGLEGHFGRLRRKRSDSGRMLQGLKMPHGMNRGVKMVRALGEKKRHIRF